MRIGSVKRITASKKTLGLIYNEFQEGYINKAVMFLCF